MLIALSVVMALLFPFLQSAITQSANMFHSKLIGGNNPYFLERLTKQLQELSKKWKSRHGSTDIKNMYADRVSKTLAMRNDTLVGKATRGLLGCKVSGENPKTVLDDVEMRATQKIPPMLFKIKMIYTVLDLILLAGVGGLLYWDGLQTGWVIGPLVLGLLVGGYMWIGRKAIMKLIASEGKNLPLFVDDLHQALNKIDVPKDALKTVLQVD